MLIAHVAQQANVSPKESVFVLTGSQLQGLIHEAAKSLNLRLDALEGRIPISQEEKIAALEATQDTQAENELNMLRIIADLRKRDPGKMEISRSEKIAKYLEARPDHKATFETLKGHLGINNDLLGKAIRPLITSGKCAIIKTFGDKRKKSLILLPR